MIKINNTTINFGFTTCFIINQLIKLNNYKKITTYVSCGKKISIKACFLLKTKQFNSNCFRKKCFSTLSTFLISNIIKNTPFKTKHNLNYKMLTLCKLSKHCKNTLQKQTYNKYFSIITVLITNHKKLSKTLLFNNNINIIGNTSLSLNYYSNCWINSIILITKINKTFKQFHLSKTHQNKLIIANSMLQIFYLYCNSIKWIIINLSKAQKITTLQNTSSYYINVYLTLKENHRFYLRFQFSTKFNTKLLLNIVQKICNIKICYVR